MLTEVKVDLFCRQSFKHDTLESWLCQCHLGQRIKPFLAPTCAYQTGIKKQTFVRIRDNYMTCLAKFLAVNGY